MLYSQYWLQYVSSDLGRTVKLLLNVGSQINLCLLKQKELSEIDYRSYVIAIRTLSVMAHIILCLFS